MASIRKGEGQSHGVVVSLMFSASAVLVCRFGSIHFSPVPASPLLWHPGQYKHLGPESQDG